MSSRTFGGVGKYLRVLSSAELGAGATLPALGTVDAELSVDFKSAALPRLTFRLSTLKPAARELSMPAKGLRQSFAESRSLTGARCAAAGGIFIEAEHAADAATVDASSDDGRTMGIRSQRNR